MKKELIIITVGYNEEKNLHKLYNSLIVGNDYFQIRKIYIDQSSEDNSVKIAKEYGCETYIHENKGYADPDKKRAVEELCNDNDRVLILDADEEIHLELWQELKKVIYDNHYEVGNILIRSIILGGFGGEAYQPRLFQKGAMKLTATIHNYLQIQSKNVCNLKTPILNHDLKYTGNEISVFTEKLNRYSSKEIGELDHLGKVKIIFNLFWKPVQWFFGFGIVHRQFLRGIKGIILCCLMAHYQWSIYAKLYEKKYINA